VAKLLLIPWLFIFSSDYRKEEMKEWKTGTSFGRFLMLTEIIFVVAFYVFVIIFFVYYFFYYEKI